MAIADLTVTLVRRPVWQWPWFALKGFVRRYREMGYREYPWWARVFAAAYIGVWKIAR